MKLYLNLFFTILFSFSVFSQENPVKIVFDVTSGNEKVHQSTMRHVKFMSEAYPKSEFEVVMYSGSIDMVLKDKSSVAEDMERLAKNENITFVVCQGTMKRHKISDDQLIPGIKQVPDGILEIIVKQQEGWGYIKEGQ